MRNFTEVKALAAEIKRKKVPITMRARLVVMKTALKMSNFDEALVCFRELRSIWQDVPPSESTAQRHSVSPLAELACKEHRLEKFLPELTGTLITGEVVHMLLVESARLNDTSLTQHVEKLARTRPMVCCE